MTHIPSEIALENPRLEFGRPTIFSVVLHAKSFQNNNDVLQSMHCLEIVLSGSVEIKRSGIAQRFSAGSLIFRKKGNYHVYPSGDYSSLWIFMENEFISSFLKQHITISVHDMNPRRNESLFSFSTSDFITANAHEVIKQIESPQPYGCCIVKFSIHQILLQLLSFDHSRSFITHLHEIAAERKIDIAYFMEENFTKQLSIADMARSTARSVSVFKKEFVVKFNMTPMKWQINRRLEYAHFLINTSAEPVSLIAYNSGFGNLSHFSKAYKKKFGVAPSKSRYELASA